MKITPSDIWEDIKKIKDKSPLIHNITNYVVMNNTANALLALGASPVMAHAGAEVEDMADIAQALVINIGTLSDSWINSMFKAAKRAGQKHIPIILDPVGAGATKYRTGTARNLIQESYPDIIRGNGSEIMALCQEEIGTRGVDSSSASVMAIDSGRHLSRNFGCVVCITGKKDYIVSDKDIIQIDNGHDMMPRVTGLGCTASALCGAFAAVNPEYQRATAHAMAVMGIAGEIAAKTAKGPGSLQVNFIDALYLLSEDQIREIFKQENC